MVHHKIQDDADIPLFSLILEPVEIGQRAVHGVNIFVIGNVVAEIDLGRGKTGGDPNGIDAKIFQIVELRGDAVQIADAIIGAVGKAAGINLVKNRVLPPLVAFGVYGLVLRKSGGGKQGENAQREKFPGHQGGDLRMESLTGRNAITSLGQC